MQRVQTVGRPAPEPGDSGLRAANGGADADRPPDGAARATAWWRSSGHRYAAALTVLLIVQAVVATVIAGRSFFFTDDFMYGSILTTQPLSLELLIRPWFGHLAPGFIAFDWVFYRVFGLNWVAATVIIVLVQLAGTIALVRLLEGLRGRRLGNIAVAALVMLSLALTTQSLWWGAVLSNVVPLVASIATLDSFVRWVRFRRARSLVAMTIAFGIAVAIFEKSVLTAAYVGALSVLVLDAGLPWRTRARNVLRRWPAWLILGVIAGADLAVYFRGSFLAESGSSPSLRELVSFLARSFPEGLVPSLFGFRPEPLTVGLSPAILIGTNAVVLGVVVWTCLRSRSAVQAWLFFAFGYVLNQGVLGRGRVGMLGVHMGTLLRYQLEDVLLFGVALAVALHAALAARSPLRLRWRRVAAAVVAVVAAAGLTPWVQGVRAEMAESPGPGSRAYVHTLRASFAEQQRQNPQLAFLAGQTVPEMIVYGAMAPYNRLDRFLPQVLAHPPFTDSSTRVLTVSPDGAVRPADFHPAVALDAAGKCLGPEESAVTLSLPSVLPEKQWSILLGYRASRATTVRVSVDNGIPGDGLRMSMEDHAVVEGSGRIVAVAGTQPIAKVTLTVVGSGSVCLTSLEFGSFDAQ